MGKYLKPLIGLALLMLFFALIVSNPALWFKVIMGLIIVWGVIGSFFKGKKDKNPYDPFPP